MCVCGKIWGQRMADGRTWKGRDRTSENEAVMVRPRKRNGKEQEIEKIPEEGWSMEFCVGAQSLAPCTGRCRVRGCGGGEGKEFWIG